MENKYFVDFQTHNKKTDAWNYKQTKIFNTPDEAEKEYHSLMSTYMLYGDLDFVHVFAYDQFGRILPTGATGSNGEKGYCNGVWDVREEPTPNEATE